MCFIGKHINLKTVFGIILISSFVNAIGQVDSVFWNELNRQSNAASDMMYQDIDSAFRLSNQLISQRKDPIDTIIYSRMLMTNGHILVDKGNFNQANLQYLKVLALREKLADKSWVSSAYHSLANINYYLKEYDATVQYARKAIDGYQINKEDFRYVSDCYNLIGVTFSDREKYDSAIYFYNIGTKILDSNSSKPMDYVYLFDNLGKALIWQDKFAEGLPYLKNNANLYLESNKQSSLIWVYTQLISTYLKLEELDSAQLYVSLIDSIPATAFTLENTKDLVYHKTLVALARKDVDSLESFVNSFYSLSDSLVTEKTNANIKDSQTKYQVEKKEAALKFSEEEKGKLSAESKAKSRLLWLTGAGIIILILLALYILRNAKHKAKLNALEIEVKNTELDELLANQESEIYASILKGQEQERERIAQDLHDRLGGTLAALKLALRKPENTVQEDDLSIIDAAVNEVRSISHNLSTGLVHKYGLNEAVNQLFKTLENSKGIKFSLYLHPEIGKLGQSLGIELYRIVQELVSNTLKHAKADEVSLQTNFSEGVFNLIYEDNGVGFNPKIIAGGIGLENVKSRVHKIKGELHIDAEEGRGSIFIVEIKK